MATRELTDEQATSIARVLYAVHQRRAARLAAEVTEEATSPRRGRDSADKERSNS